MTSSLPGYSDKHVTFCGKPFSELSDLDFALEATEYLGLLDRSAAPKIADMLATVKTEHPRAITTRYRKLGPQVPVETKKTLGLRANAFLSVDAFSDLTETGKTRALDAHETSLLRASFYKIKAETLSVAWKAGFEKVRFSPSHLNECAFCQENSNLLLYIEELSELPISRCSREACSAFISPFRDYLGRSN
jgi:hypothetical protein